MAKDMHSLLESASVSAQTRIWDLPMAVQQTEAPKDAVAGILVELGASGIRLSVDDGRLKVNAPKGALNDALKTAIASYREEIIARLRADRLQGSEGRKLRHVPRKPPLPLTAVQKRFWFLDRIGQGQSVPNVNLSLRLKGPIDFDAMMAAITTVLARHETLRLRIGDRDGEPYPEIWAAPEDLVTVVDLTAQPDAERERHGERLSKELMLEAFDLVTGPLAKVLFVRLSPTDNLVTFSMHHIVADGWSSSILLRELEQSILRQRRPASPTCFPCPISMSTTPPGRRRRFTTVCSSGSSIIGKKGWPTFRRCWTSLRITVGPCSAHSVATAWIVLSRQTWCCVCSNSAKVMTPRSS